MNLMKCFKIQYKRNKTKTLTKDKSKCPFFSISIFYLSVNIIIHENQTCLQYKYPVKICVACVRILACYFVLVNFDFYRLLE